MTTPRSIPRNAPGLGITGQRGFSLIELTTALFVLTVGLLGSIHLYYRGLDAMASVYEGRVVSNAIQNEIETLRAQPYSVLQNGADRPFISSTPGIDRLANLRSVVTIEDASDPAKRLKKVTVTAVWSGEHGRTMRRSVVALIADKEGL